jgi:hypothetical protein
VSQSTGFTSEDFDRLGRTRSEADAICSGQLKIDRLLGKLNKTMFASRFMAMRNGMGLTGHELFLTNGQYIHGNHRATGTFSTAEADGSRSSISACTARERTTSGTCGSVSASI